MNLPRCRGGCRFGLTLQGASHKTGLQSTTWTRDGLNIRFRTMSVRTSTRASATRQFWLNSKKNLGGCAGELPGIQIPEIRLGTCGDTSSHFLCEMSLTHEPPDISHTEKRGALPDNICCIGRYWGSTGNGACPSDAVSMTQYSWARATRNRTCHYV